MTIDKARIAELTKEIGMLRKVHGHLRGIPARHNAIRIAEREDLRATLELLVANAEWEFVDAR